MRPTCTHCAIKHLSQAMITLSESRQGYPTHRFYALGHMAEAGDELVKEYPKYAEMIRAERKKLEDDPGYTPDFEELIETVDEECTICQLNPGTGARLPPGRTKTDEELQAIVDTYNESELFGLKFGLLPHAKTPEDLTGQDVAVMMKMEPGSPPLENPLRGARRNNPISWTKCELRYPVVQEKIEACVLKLKDDPRVKNPYAVCRASIGCPPNPGNPGEYSVPGQVLPGRQMWLLETMCRRYGIDVKLIDPMIGYWENKEEIEREAHVRLHLKEKKNNHELEAIEREARALERAEGEALAEYIRSAP